MPRRWFGRSREHEHDRSHRDRPSRRPRVQRQSPKGEIVEAYWDCPPDGFYIKELHELTFTVKNTGEIASDYLLQIHDSFGGKTPDPVYPLAMTTAPASYQFRLEPEQEYTAKKRLQFKPGLADVRLNLKAGRGYLDRKNFRFRPLGWPFTTIVTTVDSETNEPIPGIEVHCFFRQDRPTHQLRFHHIVGTDENGVAEFSDTYLPELTLEVRTKASYPRDGKPGYEANLVKYEVSEPNGKAEITIPLKRKE
jgi:hypothetical protein